MLFAQYLLTPSFDQYQTWCRGCTNKIMISIDCEVTCSKVKVKPLFWAQCVVRIFYSLCLPVLALDRFCFYREDKPEFCIMGGGGIYVSEIFLVFNPFWKCILKELIWPLDHLYNKRVNAKQYDNQDYVWFMVGTLAIWMKPGALYWHVNQRIYIWPSQL